MGQLTLFPLPTPVIRRSEPIDAVRVVGVASALDLARPVPHELVRVGPQIGLRYVPQWELDASRITAHLSVEPIPPSAPGRRVIAETVEGQVIEQDCAGGLWTDGERIGAGALISFCALPDEVEQELHLGVPAGWLLAERHDGAFVFSVHVSPRLLWVFALPRALGAAGTFSGWTVAAAHLLPPSTRYREEWAAGDHDAHFDPAVIGVARGGEVTGP